MVERIDGQSQTDSNDNERGIAKSLDHGPEDAGNQNPNEAHVSDPRVQYVVSKVDKDGRRVESAGKPPTTQKTQKGEERSNIAFVVNEIWDDEGKVQKTVMILKGQELREIMQDVLGKRLEHEQRTDWAAKEQMLDDSCSSEIRYWNELSEAARSCQGSEQGRKDLQLLLKHIQHLKPETVKLMESIQKVTKIFPDDLWYLFRPGDLVISKPYLDQPQLFRISDSHWIQQDEGRIFQVVVWAFDWTGTELTQNYYALHIRPAKQNGEKKEKMDIVDLPCYPIRYHKNNEGDSGDEVVKALSDDLIARGQAFRKLCSDSVHRRQYSYNGELLCAPRQGSLEDDWFHHMVIRDDIMIDFTAFKRFGPGIAFVGNISPQTIVPCRCKLCFDEKSNPNQWMRDFAEKDGERDSEDKKKNYLLLPARALGYCLHNKIWAQFDVTKVKGIESPSSKEFSEKLIFPEDSKTVKEDLKTLVEQHGKPNDYTIGDPIAGKGCGLVILLHGPPGVGKTLTAETLAKSSGKPLYVVGASDIGLEPRLAEATLAQIFELAERWEALLLIDEADVFLDSRGTKGEADVTKNALVSVMLRVLEYFKGILIMTTNRVMTFDIAMLSRCHYAIDFKSLTREQEKKIWQGYLDQLTEKNCRGKSDIETWVSQTTRKRTKLSGREIRNVFTTAQTLAQAEPDRKMMRTHLERVYERLTEFLEAMENTKTHAQAALNATY